MILPDENPNPPQSPPPRNPLRPLLAATILTIVIAAFGGAALSHVLWPSSSNAPASGNAGGSPSSGGGFPGAGGGANPSSYPAHAAAVARRIDPGLVDINTQTAEGPAAGTGMVITSGGEVLTNNHVIAGAQRISVTDVGNHRTYGALVVGYDRTQDVAVIMLQNASGLATVPLGNSNTVKVGASVITFGNAGGVGGTPSEAGGSVSSLNQSIRATDPSTPGNAERLRNLIEINGDIQPGDSGGPLTIAGKVVGMDTAASVGFSFQSNSGAGFAIPINQALAIARQIVAGHQTSLIHIGKTAIIGVYVASNSPINITQAGCPTANEGARGVLIAPGPGGSGVIAGSPASGTSMQTCDVITRLGSTPTPSPTALLNAMERHHPGNAVSITWLDTSGVSHSARIVLATGAPN